MKKKDWDYIAKLEKAIAEKYGEEAVQNPAKFWDKEKEKEYLKELKEQGIGDQSVRYEEKVEVDGFFIPKKLINKDTNRVCPVCGVYSFIKKDDVYMNKYECCYKCFITYVEDREERWLNGWRPKNNGK